MVSNFADEYALSADTITDAQSVVVKRNALAALAERDVAIGRELHALTARELRRVRSASCCSSTARRSESRVPCWIMAERAATAGAIELPMSRQDIADYLGLTIETVSRTLCRARKRRRHRSADLAADRIAQPSCAEPDARLEMEKR